MKPREVKAWAIVNKRGNPVLSGVEGHRERKEREQRLSDRAEGFDLEVR